MGLDNDWCVLTPQARKLACGFALFFKPLGESSSPGGLSEVIMDKDWKRFTDFLVREGIDRIAHTDKTYLAHLIAVYKDMEAAGCSQELCRAGMFHSIYGTERFQGFKLPLERRPEVRDLIGQRAEWLAYLNCAMDRPAFDRALEKGQEPFLYVDRITKEEIKLSAKDFDESLISSLVMRST